MLSCAGCLLFQQQLSATTQFTQHAESQFTQLATTEFATTQLAAAEFAFQFQLAEPTEFTEPVSEFSEPISKFSIAKWPAEFSEWLQHAATGWATG